MNYNRVFKRKTMSIPKNVLSTSSKLPSIAAKGNCKQQHAAILLNKNGQIMTSKCNQVDGKKPTHAEEGVIKTYLLQNRLCILRT